MFKPLSQLTNVRPSKSESPELLTSPSSGQIKINAPAAKLLGVSVEDYLTIIDAETDNGKQYFVAKGHAANDGSNGQPKVAQVGGILSSPSGVAGGTLSWGSQNAWNTLGGNKTTKKIFSIAEEPFNYEGTDYYLLTLVREEAKPIRKSKEATA